jgi:hypothetical protein
MLCRDFVPRTDNAAFELAETVTDNFASDRLGFLEQNAVSRRIDLQPESILVPEDKYAFEPFEVLFNYAMLSMRHPDILFLCRQRKP